MLTHMAFRCPRGVVKDIPFVLLDAPQGSAIDPWGWTDGLDADQWPRVTFWTGPNATGTDVTADFALDITAVTITSATHKHPDGTTGLWRKDQGTFRARIRPDPTLLVGAYYLHQEFEPNENETYAEDIELEVIASGDVIFGNISVTPDDITANLQTSLEEDQIYRLIERATNRVSAMISACGGDPDAFDEGNGMLRDAIIQFAQSYIVDYDGSAGGYVTSRKEGRKEVRYSASTTKLGDNLRDDAMFLVQQWCSSYGNLTRAMGGVVERRIRGSYTARGGGSRREWEAGF